MNINIYTLVTSLFLLPTRMTKALLAITLSLLAGFPPTGAVAQGAIEQPDPTFNEDAGSMRDDQYCDRTARNERELELCLKTQAEWAESELNEMYRDAMEELSSSRRNALRQEERAWIKWREAECARQAEEARNCIGGCGVPWTSQVVCMIKEAHNRVEQLKTQWYQLRPINEDSRYKIVMSKDKRLCIHIREALNDDLSNYGPGYDPRKFAASIFSAITWTPIKGLEEGFNYSGAVAYVDLNNDGTTDILVRQETHIGKGGMIGVHGLFIFKEDQYPELAKRTNELEENAIGFVLPVFYEFRGLPQKTFQTPGVLKGKKYYEGLLDDVFIHPFAFQKKTYLLLTQSPDSPAVPKWALVAHYKQGKVREADSALMEDVCYLKLK